jgi:hypothetical protein
MTELNNYLKPFTDKNAQLVTRAKSKRAASGNLKFIATNNFIANFQLCALKCPPALSPKPLCNIKKQLL